MALNEFSIIQTYFAERTHARSDVLLGIGDDGALLKVPQDQVLVTTLDTMVAGIHFPFDTDPADVGYKALAVNLSDLAAMGAEPCWMSLALTMPEANADWLEKFSKGLFLLAKEFHIQLIGGDTSCGPLSVTLHLSGFIPPGQALLRQGANVGDKIYVSGTLGDAGLALQVLSGSVILPTDAKEYVLQRLNRPTPKIELGYLLRGIASSAIDISDGLAADLTHILDQSGVGATINANDLPMSSVLTHYTSSEVAKKLALTSGDDYELCFTVSPKNEEQLIIKLKDKKIECRCIGEIEKTTGLRVDGFQGELVKKGYLHF